MRRPIPLPLVALFTLLPAAPLAGAWGYADARVPPPTTTTTVPDPGVPSPELVTDLLSMRRRPDLVAADIADRREAARWDGVVDRFVSTVDVAEWCVRLDEDGEVLAEEGEGDGLLVPASNEKLLVAAAALDVIGPETRFRTVLVGPEPVDGVVTGDVYLVGGGDPLLVTGLVTDPHRYPAINTTDLGRLVDKLTSKGITRIDGDIVGDGTRYDDEFAVPSWGTVSQYDVQYYDALLVDDGQFAPQTYGMVPAQSAARSLANLLAEREIAFTGSTRNGQRPDGLTVLAGVQSAPLDKVVEQLLLTSDNVTAEMLLKEIGYVARGEGTRAAGIAVVREKLIEWGVDLDGLVIDDGSGLSRDNRMSCAALTGVLAGSPVDLTPLLPVAGRTGTLAGAFEGSPAVGRLAAKTGTLNGVKSLSGTMVSAGGRTVDFALLLNGEGISAPEAYGPIWEALAELIDEWPVVVEIDPGPLGPVGG